jgi:hypothetical protein
MWPNIYGCFHLNLYNYQLSFSFVAPVEWVNNGNVLTFAYVVIKPENILIIQPGIANDNKLFFIDLTCFYFLFDFLYYHQLRTVSDKQIIGDYLYYHSD